MRIGRRLLEYIGSCHFGIEDQNKGRDYDRMWAGLREVAEAGY